jgi:cell wall-associated NlpC family hydrolase
MVRAVLSILLISAFASCNTIHNLAAKDDSSEKSQPKSRKNGQVVFIDNITVTPGGSVTSNQNSRTSSSKNTSSTTISHIEPNKEFSSGSTIESADQLQLKYAIVFDATVERLTNLAMLRSIDKWWGTRYCLGGNSESCVDCSAFTMAIMKDVYSLSLPRTAQEQYNASTRIETEELKEGDLVFFYTSGRRISHVGIYIMNNKFVHAAASQGVSVSDLNDTYWKARYRGAGRIVSAKNDLGTK